MSPQKTMWVPFIVFRPMDKFESINLINEKNVFNAFVVQGI